MTAEPVASCTFQDSSVSNYFAENPLVGSCRKNQMTSEDVTPDTRGSNMTRAATIYISLAISLGLLAWLPALALNMEWINRNTFQLTAPVSGPPIVLVLVASDLLGPLMDLGAHPYLSTGIWLVLYLLYYAIFLLPVGVFLMPLNVDLSRWRERKSIIFVQAFFMVGHVLLVQCALAILRE